MSLKDKDESAVKTAIEQMKQQIKQYKATQDEQQAQIQSKADEARIEKFEKELEKLYYGDPEDQNSRHDSIYALSERFAEPGGKSYENLKSSYQEIMQLMVKLCYFLSAFFRTNQRLAGGLSMAGALFSKIMDFAGATPVELHEDLMKASVCGPDGVVKCKFPPRELFTAGTPDEMIQQVDDINKFLVKAFLTFHGYDKDDKGVYSRKVAGKSEILTPEKFERIKRDPEDGLKAFAESFHMRLTNGPMGPRGEKAPDPEPIASSTPRPKPY